MARREKKPVHKVVMTEGKRNIIQQLLNNPGSMSPLSGNGGVLPQLSVFLFLYYRKYSIINISKDMREEVKCQVHTVHYV